MPSDLECPGTVKNRALVQCTTNIALEGSCFMHSESAIFSKLRTFDKFFEDTW